MANTSGGGGGGGRAAPAGRDSWSSTIMQSVLRALMLYAFLKYNWNKDAEKTAKGGKSPAAAAPPPADDLSIKRRNLWPAGAEYEVRAYASLLPAMTFGDALAAAPFFAESGLTYDFAAGNARARNVTLPVPRAVAAGNASWFAHVFAAQTPVWKRAPDSPGNTEAVLHERHDIVAWRAGPPPQKEKSLLDDSPAETPSPAQDAAAAAGKTLVSQLWKPTMPITTVVSSDAIVLSGLPEPVQKRYRVARDVAGYFPPLYVNEFWQLRESLRPMNGSVESVVVEVSVAPISMYKWTMFEQFEWTLATQISYGASSEKEKDKVKQMFLETNPVLLGTTMAVSVAHSVLEMLAFKNDISHWKSIKSIEGISVRSMVVKIFMEIVIFLYLWDNDTSWMIILGNAVGIAIEVWKLCKAVEFKNFGKRRLLGFIPWFEMKDRESYSKKTKEYDEEAMRYLSYIGYPLMVGYSIYSLVYEKHKSWYSWVLGSLVGTVYTFGFIMMFPQIFINYKLKSVAHLPMKAMMYKTLNTVIDDLFSFVIKMPWLHRLACFRDDVVFGIYLYQRWIYPVDKTRVNEFGQSFDADGNEIVREAKPNAPKQSASNSDASNEIASAASDATCLATSEAPKETDKKDEVKAAESVVEEDSGPVENVEPKPAGLKKND